MTERLQGLRTWLGEGVGLSAFELEPIAGDASFRRYFRVRMADGATAVAMDAPPQKESSRPFVEMARLLEGLGVHVPAIRAQDLDQGYLLLEDLGGRHYLDALDETTVERLYGDALGALVTVQALGPREGLPAYDRTLLWQEMNLFRDWLLDRHLGIGLSDEETAMLERLFGELVENALEQPRVCVLRDFHSRNLMVTPRHNPGVLDFQDAVCGPVTYDLVSLLKDCYIAWPRARVEAWVAGYFDLAVQSGVLPEEHEKRFLRWFDLMGAQRHLKAAGIFARLNVRDSKPGYLPDIPRTLGYLVALGERYPELEAAAAFCRDRVLPRLA
ncbi:MAG TPA: aminoglycoside phosphotransferase [Sedimenticola sp.]|nr:aminoglycoside phosphotransferase [Sedimenticola sp.]